MRRRRRRRRTTVIKSNNPYLAGGELGKAAWHLIDHGPRANVCSLGPSAGRAHSWSK